MAGLWTDVVALLPFLLLLPLGGGELFAAQGEEATPAWYLSGGSGAGTVPGVVMHDVLAPDLLGELWKLAEDLPDRPGVELGEYWLPLGAEPINTWEQAVLQIAAADLTHVLPPAVAARVGGVAWRMKQVASEDKRRGHTFHFDSDEETLFIVPGVPVVHPLLSTVTYLSPDGSPTVVLDYTMLDSPNATFLPQGGFIVMPARNKHLAFDPRLAHGVVGRLDYQHSLEPGTSRRIIIGMNFWEEVSMEALPNWRDRQKQRPPARLPAAHVDHRRPHPNLRLLPLTGGRSGALPFLTTSTCTAEQPEGMDEPQERFGTSASFKYTKCRFTLRLPRGKLFDLERVERGRTARFEFCEGDLSIEYHPSPPPYPPEVPAPRRRRGLGVAERMLESRCGTFRADGREMVPPAAVDFCKERGLALRRDDEGGSGNVEL